MNEIEIDRTKFNKDQLFEIDMGERNGVDVSLYADTKYPWVQMAVIRMVLERGLDATPYIEAYNIV